MSMQNRKRRTGRGRSRIGMALGVKSSIELLESAKSGDRRSLARLLTLIEEGEDLVLAEDQSCWRRTGLAKNRILFLGKERILLLQKKGIVLQKRHMNGSTASHMFTGDISVSVECSRPKYEAS